MNTWFRSLDEWLAWQETLHPSKIELGLDRVRAVWCNLSKDPLPFRVITVGGTNGKGSSVAMLESILRAGNYRVGAYTSPHLLRYKERIRVNGQEAEDRLICDAFERVDQARGEVSLTYFEFGTLAALLIFQEADLDVAILEVGMGGRLDAVNILDADVAVVTSIGIDHVEWLGGDRETIGLEKAGIFRSDRFAVCGDPAPPHSLVEYAHRVHARLYCLGTDFGYSVQEGSWTWHGLGIQRSALPMPALRGKIQLQNAAAVVAALQLLASELPLTQDDVRRGLLATELPGRFQVVPGEPLFILDVAHNPDGARVLADNLSAHACRGRTLAVVGMLKDKDVEKVARTLDPTVDVWYAAGLQGSSDRGMDGEGLAVRLRNARLRGMVRAYNTVAEACAQAAAEARPGDRVIVFGSFYTVADALGQCV
jgi:dihydrofolate synthase/folylpolyglutamate synthase